MKAIPLKILGFGKHHPPRAISAAEIDARAGLAPGWTLRHSGVHTRYFAENETASAMGAQPVLWHEIIFGFFGDFSQPSASSSANAFHIPINPVPPPVG